VDKFDKKRPPHPAGPPRRAAARPKAPGSRPPRRRRKDGGVPAAQRAQDFAVYAFDRGKALFWRAVEEVRRGGYARWALVAAGCLVVLIIAVLFVTRGNAYQVFLDDTPVGYIAYDKKVTADALQKSAVDALAQTNGTEIKPLQTVRLVRKHASGGDIQTADAIVKDITGGMTYQIQGAQITVDGKPVAMLASPASANSALDAVKNSYAVTADNITSQTSSFVENVQVVPTFIQPGVSLSLQEAVNTLKSTTPSQVSYTVVSGDSAAKIASKNGMNLNEFMALNGLVGPNPRLQIGQVLKLSIQKPVVSVKDVVVEERTETVPKKVVNQQNPSQPATYSMVIQQGQDGQRKVTTQTTYINGVQTDKTDSAVVTVQPVDELIEVGTQK